MAILQVAVVAGPFRLSNTAAVWQQVQNPDPAGYPVRRNSRRQSHTGLQKRGIGWVGLPASPVPSLFIPSCSRMARQIAQASEPHEIGYAERRQPYSPTRRPHHRQTVKHRTSTSNTIGRLPTRPGRNREAVSATQHNTSLFIILQSSAPPRTSQIPAV